MEFRTIYAPVQKLEQILINFVTDVRNANGLEYGYAQVQWRQLSIIFCTTSQTPATMDSILFFGKNRETFIPESFPLREHLLFVNYNSPTEQLTILGDLSFSAYNAFMDSGYISVSELRREGGLLYDEYPPEEQFVTEARNFSNFYIPHFTTPDQVFPGVSPAKQNKILANVFQDVVYGIPRRKTDSNGKEELLFYEIIMQRLLCQKHREIGFYYACLLSSLHNNFHTEYVIYEQARLYVLLELFFINESKRVGFVQRWLGSSVTIHAPVQTGQFYNRPAEFDVMGQKSELDALQRRHAVKYPGRPFPGLYFSAPLLEAPSLQMDPSLPVRNGIVSFTHYELIHFLDPMVERSIQVQVDYFRQHCGHYLFEQFITPMLMNYFYSSNTPVHVVELRFRKAHPKLEESDAEIIVERFRKELPIMMGKKVSPFHEAIKSVSGLDNIVNVTDRFTVWPRARATIDLTSVYYKTHPELKALHQEPTPASYQDLLEYAERCWPPCMQKLATGRFGAKHMHHEERIAMSAQLRRFGYTEQQGTGYWHLLFQETDLYKQHGEHNFLESQQGLVIVYDYKRDRQVNTGVSCRNWIGRRFCPFVDIEDLADNAPPSCDCKEKNGPQFQCTCREVGCQNRCKAKFASLNPGFVLPFEVKSPRDYFFQARDSLGSELHKKKV